MAELISYNSCPCCNSKDFSFFLKAKDYTVSNELFEVMQCKNCSVAFTQNIPVQNEIGKYYQSSNYISHSDTQQGLISKIYHKVRNITLVSKKNLVEQFTKKQKGNLLDIGAGIGSFSFVMKQANWQITALEPDEIARKNAKNKYNLDLQSPEKLFDFAAESFDAITLWHVLEHIHTLSEYLQAFNKALKKDGKLFIAVPNYTSFDAKYYKESWAGYDVPRHLYHFSPKSMNLLASKFGFNIVKTKPMWFDSTYVAMLSEQYKNGKGNILKAFLIGMISNLKVILNNRNCSSVIYILEKINK